MTTAATSLLGLALPVTGELSGTWGDTVNNSITSLLDTAVAGTTTLSTDGDVTLSTTTLAANQARQAIILWTANGTTTRNITAPAQSKIYTVINASAGTQSIVLRGAGPTTGVTIIKGESAVCAWNGSDFIKISNTGGSASFTNVTVSGTTTLSGLTASTALALDASKNVVSVTNTGTGNNVLSASPTLTGTVAGASLSLSSLTSGRVTYAGTSGLLQDSSNLTFDGTTLTAGGLATGGSVTLSGGTANGVLYLNGSKVATSGSALTFDGTTLSATSGGSTPALRVFGVGTGQGQLQFGSINGYLIQGGADYLGINFNTNNATRYYITDTGVSVWSVAGSEQMRLTSTGLGIGTSSPSTKLDISGGSMQVRTGGKVITDTVENYGAALFLNAAGSLPIYFALNGTTAMTLSTSGNLGLGVTPSAWQVTTGRKAIEVGSAGNGLYGYGGSNFNMSSGAYFDGSWKYAVSSFGVSYYNQNSGIHSWYNAPSGTAGNAISFTQAMTLDASGRLLVGTTTANQKLTISGGIAAVNDVVTASTGSLGVVIGTASAAAGTTDLAYIVSDNGGYGGYNDLIISPRNNTGAVGNLRLYTGGTERARIDSSGNLFIGQTARAEQNSDSFDLDVQSKAMYVNHSSGTTTGTGYLYFGYNTTNIGSITQSGTTAVLFNVTSDQRLKENIVDAPEFGSVIDAIKVRSYDWKADGNHQRAGFVAQELVTVAPEAVHQPADPEQMMAVDYSKLVPMLVKEIQSLRARVASLES